VVQAIGAAFCSRSPLQPEGSAQRQHCRYLVPMSGEMPDKKIVLRARETADPKNLAAGRQGRPAKRAPSCAPLRRDERDQRRALQRRLNARVTAMPFRRSASSRRWGEGLTMPVASAITSTRHRASPQARRRFASIASAGA